MLENVAQFVESVYDDLCDGCHASLKTQSLNYLSMVSIWFYSF